MVSQRTIVSKRERRLSAKKTQTMVLNRAETGTTRCDTSKESFAANWIGTNYPI